MDNASAAEKLADLKAEQEHRLANAFVPSWFNAMNGAADPTGIDALQKQQEAESKGGIQGCIPNTRTSPPETSGATALQEMEAARNLIRTFINCWVPRLNLYNWEIECIYSYDRHPDNPRHFAEAHCTWKYMHGSITFYLPVAIGKSERQLESFVLHELLHFVVNEMREWERQQPDSVDHEERVVTHLERVIMELQS